MDAGDITWQGEVNLAQAVPGQAGRAGLFLAFQYPSAIPGVTVASFLRNIYNAVHHQPSHRPTTTARRRSSTPASRWPSSASSSRRRWRCLNMDPAFATRYVNDGFSGGEKKRLEMLQLAVQSPRRWRSSTRPTPGLDIDALRNVADGINATLSAEMGVLMITHYQRMLNYVKPDQSTSCWTGGS